MSFNDWLNRRRRYTPERVGVVDDASGRRYRYVELDARASRVADHLQGPLDVQPGDRVACLASNRIEYIDLYFACGKIGAILVPLNVRLPAAAIIELLQDCRAKVMVCESTFAETEEAVKRSEVVPQWWRMDVNDRSKGTPSVAQVAASTDEGSPAVEIYQADESDPAMILYTSGTTGRAKGAMITYRQIHWNAFNTTISLQMTQDDAAFLNMPLYHTGGWHVLFTPLMLLGGRVILQQRFDAHRCNEIIGPEGVTILFGVPTTLRMMCEAANFVAADFSRVRCAIFGGERCPLPVINAFAQRGVAMRQGFGLTEAGPNCFSLSAEDAIRKQGSIGFPNFFVKVRLQKDDGAEAEVGEVGELLMKGPHLCGGYWGNPDATETAFPGGWHATGDLMTRDDDGYYYVVGRKKDMYVSGGENVYPAEVERLLQSHEAVALAAVVGVPDPKWGETGWAFVKLHAQQSTSEDRLLVWCKLHLAAFQRPAKIVIMDDLPMGHSGKIDKLALVELARTMAER